MFDDSAVLSDTSLSLVEELRSVRESIKSLKAREKEIRDALLIELKGVDYGITASGEPLIEVQRYPRTGLNSDRLQALYRSAWDDCQTSTEVEVLRFPETP